MATSTEPEQVDERQPLLPQSDSNLERNQQQEQENVSSTFYLNLTVLAVGAFLANVDVSFVIATYNNISSDFSQASAGPWILIAYNLGLSVALPLYGALGDQYGTTIPLMVAYVSFGAGGLAPNVWTVIAGRGISGTGGGGMSAMVQYTITKSVPPEQVAMYSSYIYVLQNIGRSFGGPLGGVLADAVGWRWSFLGQAPIVAICLLCIAWLSISTRRRESDQKNAEGNAGAKDIKAKRTVDFAGIAAFIVMLTSFLLAISISDNTSHLAFKSYGTALVVTCAVAAIALFFIERDYAKTPLIPLGLLKGSLGVQMIVQVILLIDHFCIVSNAATYYVRTSNASNTACALYLVPLAVGHSLGTVIGGRVIKITKRYKHLASTGLLLTTLGFILMAIRWQGPISIPESLYITLPSLGLGIVTSTQFTALNLKAPKDRAASAISLYLLCQQIGVMLGISSSAALIHTTFRDALSERLDSLPGKDKIIQKILDETRYAFTLPKSDQETVIQSYVVGFRTVCVLSTGLSILLQIILGLMKEQPLK